jgi:hypothetical protein
MKLLSKIIGVHFLRTSDDFVTYGLMCLGVGIWLLLVAVTGDLVVLMRGYGFFNFQLKSRPFRIVCFVLSVGFFTAATWMFRHSLPSLHNP